jgi:phosphatidylglycerophosphate synthase
MHPWRERLSRWFTPLARRCPLSPNAITLIALALNLVAAACMFFGNRWPILFLVSIVFLTAGGLADAFDGIVARVQEKSSPFGDFLDHVADRVSDTAVAAAWMIGSGVRYELTLVAVIMVMLNGYVGTQIEATWKERSYEGVGRGEFVLALVVFPIVSFILFSNGWKATAVPDWMAVVLIAFALLGIVQRITMAARLERRR